MASKLVFYENCDILLYFGVHEREDLPISKLVINFFNEKKVNTSWPFKFDEDFYEKLFRVCENNVKKRKLMNHNRHEDFTEINKSSEKMRYYKKLLDELNFGFADDVIEKIEESLSKTDDQDLFELIRQMDRFHLLDWEKLKKQSKIIVFILNKTYFDSELFKKHWQEANELKKQIVFLLDTFECIPRWNTLDVLIFKIIKTTSEFNVIADRYCQNTNQVRFDDFILKFQTKKNHW